MADKSAKEAKISIKVFVDTVKKKVVYAEADHSFVDILFGFMTLPMGTIVRILGKLDDKKFETLGSLKNLHQSLMDFPESYLSTEECKYMLLNPRSLSYDLCRNLKLKIDDTEPIKYFVCKNCWPMYFYFSVCTKARCMRCGKLMNYPHYPEPNACVGGGVFVSNLATFIVTDDLSVMPYSAAGIFGLLTDLGITDTTHLEEKKVEMSLEQMLYLLKMVMSLDSPLTHFIYNRTSLIQDEHFVSASTFDQSNFKIKETSASSKMVLEVSMQKSTGKVLFAEANEDFIDFLFGILSVPLGTIVGTLMNGASSVGCTDNIFKSISSMSVGRYIKSQDIKDMLLKPHFGQPYSSKNQVFPLTTTITKVSRRGNTYELKDPRLNKQLLRQSGLFFVTDDLVISPSSSHLAINTLEKLKVPFYDVERHVISFGLEEALRLLKSSLRSKLVLTSILKHQLKK